MDGTIGLLGGTPGGGGVPSGGSILTMSKEDSNNQNIRAEVSASYPVEDDGDSDELELGLGLTIGGGARILTAKDFPILISKPNSSSSSSSCSSSSVNIPNSFTAGTKRAATATDSSFPLNSTSVVGWPPIRRAYRTPILASQSKSEHEAFRSRAESKNKTNGHQYVKVNMDGTLIGRKVDLSAHSSYDMLAKTLESMFDTKGSNREAAGSSRLLTGTAEFVLTYEDRDGDCMLVGDIPWQMFVNSVKRLRIMKNPESSGLATTFQDENRRQRTN